jgi:hypothetical protein
MTEVPLVMSGRGRGCYPGAAQRHLLASRYTIFAWLDRHPSMRFALRHPSMRFALQTLEHAKSSFE